MVVGEKNRCIRISAPGAGEAPFRGGFWGTDGDKFRDNLSVSRVPVT